MKRISLLGPVLVLVSLLVVVAPLVSAQETAPAQEAEAVSVVTPRPLTIDEYARWRTVESVGVSADGTWVSFAYSRREADDELHLRRLSDGHEYVIDRATGAVLSDDGRFAVYHLSPGWEEIEKLRKEGDRVPVQAQLIDLSSGEKVFTWDDVDRVEMARGGAALAVKRHPADEDADHDGTDLILVHLADGTEELLGSVHEFAFNKAGTHLAYTVDAASDNGNGLYLIDLSTGVRRALDNAKADYAQLTWNEPGTALAVLRGSKPEGFDERENVLVAFADATDGPTKLVFDPAADESFPADFVVSERGRVLWNEDGTRVFFGIKEQMPEPEKTDEPIADVNIFHWQDDRLQTVQKVQADRDRDFTYLSTLDVQTGRFNRLIEEDIRRIEIARDGRWVVAWDQRPYVSDWQPPYADVYRIDPATGERTLMLERQLRTYGLSPDGGHFLFWNDGQMWDWRLDTGESVDLTSSAPVSFVDMEWDYYGERPAYGVAGWTAEGDSVILEHRYDLWLQPLDGRAATNLTGGAGDRDEVRYRYLQLDPEARTIDLEEPQMLAAYGEWTKKSGFFELPPGGGEPLPLVWADKMFGRPVKAREAHRLLYTIQDFRQFPDWWVADYAPGDASGSRQTRVADAPTYGDDNGDDPVPSAMAIPTRLTDAIPFQDEYLWGDRMLFEYTNADGVRLQGTLAIPDTYQPGDKLPMIVRFYEKYSQDLHRYPTVRYRHEPNFGDYVSNGYLVMQPDIHFRGGSSHSDMLECVEAATRKVIEMGYAHPAQIGLSGHSYSGGGSSYIAARSDMFAAVASGAAPINLTSEFNQLFLGTGGNNHSYDIYGQGRYGTNPYDDPEVYEYESPITWVREMDTPLLYLHGEDDQIVGYVQGMEWYNALRFNEKPIIFLSYPGEGHGLRKFENQIDFQQRLHQFFDHHLKDEPAPDWMVRGRTFLAKERELRRRER